MVTEGCHFSMCSFSHVLYLCMKFEKFMNKERTLTHMIDNHLHPKNIPSVRWKKFKTNTIHLLKTQVDFGE